MPVNFKIFRAGISYRVTSVISIWEEFRVMLLFIRQIIYIKNNGPRTEPCGTPCLIFFHPEEVLL
jgi:hypothetical protein